MWVGAVENFHLTADRLAALEALEARIMGESGVNSYSLQPIAHYGRLFTLETFEGAPGGTFENFSPRDALGTIICAIPPGVVAGDTGGRAGTILGAAEFVRAFDNIGLAHLFGFYTVETIRGSGAASFFLDACEKRLAAAFSIRSVDLTVSGENTRAIAFYRKNGYAVALDAPDYYGGGRGRLIMSKTL